MIAKARSREENLPSVRLFRTEINSIVGMFAEYCANVVISDDEYVYQDLQELRDRLGPRLRKFQIAGLKPNVSLSFEIYGLKLAVQY
jgi:hypothetical protein